MSFEVYVKQTKTKSSSPMITLGKKLGRCVLNRAAAIQFDKEGTEYVLILWDKDRRVFGVKASNKKDPRAFALRFSRSKEKDRAVVSATFSGVTFLNWIGYDLTTTHQYPIKWNQEEEIYEVALPAERFQGGQQPLVAVEGGKKEKHARTGH